MGVGEKIQSVPYGDLDDQEKQNMEVGLMPRMLKYQEAIKNVLLNIPESRDDDAILIYRTLRAIVQSEYGDDLLPLWTVSNYLGAIQEQRVPPPDTITRLRRLLQKEHPLLRGKRYNERHGLEPAYQEELRYANRQ